MEYQHFSHKHLLIPLHFDNQREDEINYCKACERVINSNEQAHGCLSCKYFLHDQCLNLPRWLQHQSHNSHPLTLLPSPTYPHGSYFCNACGSPGNSFSFGCAQCEFDLHTRCANLPNEVLIGAHPHELKLILEIPNDENIYIVCDVCGGLVDKRFWIYKCVDYGFDCHLDCVNHDTQRTGLNHENQEVGHHELRVNDSMDPIRQAANQMMEDQLEMMRLQNQLNRTRMMANVMTWA